MSASRIRPSAGWYWLAVLIFVGGAAGAVFLGVNGFRDFIGKVDSFQRVAPPGGDVTLEAGEYTLYVEGPGVGEGALPVAVREVSVTTAEGQEVPLSGYDAEVTYSFGGHSGRALASLRIDQPGTYQVAVSGNAGGVEALAVGEGLGVGPLASIFGALALGGVSFVLALLVVIVTAVRRGRAKRRLAMPYGPPVYGVQQQAWPPR